jgi:alkylation response protein AidB-like acyl-CoA dehydrogenase
MPSLLNPPDLSVGTVADVRALAEDVIQRNAGADEVALLGALFDHGLAWVHWPEGRGGLNRAPSDQRVVDEVLDAAGRRASWLRNPMGIGMVAPALLAHGTPEQQSRYLRPIFTAEEIWCQLFSEPGAGSDVATLATTAVRDGDEWVVNGQKVWTSSAHLARWGLLLARTDPELPKHEGLTAFVLDMRGAGVDVRPMRMITGDAHFNEVFLTDVRIAEDQRVGSVGDGWRVAVTTLMNERVSIGGAIQPRGSGDIAGALEAWRELGGTASQRDRLARLWIEAEVVRLVNLRAEQLRTRGTPGPEGSVSKLAGALLSQRITSFTLELLGAAGMLYPDHGVDREFDRSDPVVAFLMAQSATIAGGTSEIMRDILGQRVLGLPPEPRVDKGRPWRDIPKGA